MKRLVLVGAGHAHAQVLLEFSRRRSADIEIVLISPAAQAPYSGMVPGWLAGHYRWEECCIDFASLCARAGATLRLASVIAVDADRREVMLSDGERIGYQWLSLNIGSTLTPPASQGIEVLPMRPLAALRERWDALLEAFGGMGGDACHHIAMVGGGTAGVESILAAHRRLTQLAPQARLRFSLVTQGTDIVPGMADGALRRLKRHLQARGIEIVNGFSAGRIEANRIMSADGAALTADTVLWATGAQAYEWLRHSGLALDERGFIRIDSRLRSVSHPNVFAVGDCAAWDQPLPKAGVYAVRMGPVLSHNLHASIHGGALQSYEPQRRYLVLVGTGAAHAVAAWGSFAWQGRWVWRWKQAIDRRFIARYNAL